MQKVDLPPKIIICIIDFLYRVQCYVRVSPAIILHDRTSPEIA